MKAMTVRAAGMVTPLGYTAAATLAALRGGISAIRQLPWLDPESGEPLRGAKVPLPQWWEGAGKLADLVSPAIHECMQAASPAHPRDIPVLLGVPARSRSARYEVTDSEILHEIEQRLNLPLHEASSVFSASQTACVHALLQAQGSMTDECLAHFIVAGVDSYLQEPTLDYYVEQRRLMTPSNSNGFFPGEAGCAVLVSPAASASAPGLHVVGMALGHEPSPIHSTKPFQASGLTQAVKRSLALAGLAMKDVSFRLTDLTGEHYKFKEAAFVAARLDRGTRDTALPLWHPIEYVGEIGAAIVPCLLAWAMHAQQQQYAPGPVALCHVGNDDGERAALILKYVS